MVGQFFGSSHISVEEFLEPLSEQHANFRTMLVYAHVEVESRKKEAKILDVIGGHATSIRK